MNKLKVFEILLLSFCGSLFSYAAYAIDQEKISLDALDKSVQEIVNTDRLKYQIPGISVAIKLPNEQGIREYVSGYYSLAEDRKIAPDTIFQIGSITKTFIASIIFKLVEENKIFLDDKLSKWFPQYPRWSEITVRNLLNHSSGIYNYTHGSEFDKKIQQNPYKQWKMEELVNIAYQHADGFKAGEKFSYSNTDYILLGWIIEKVTDQNLQQIFSRYFAKYNLSNTFYAPFGYPEGVKQKMANGYNRDGTLKPNTDVTSFSLSIGQSAGAMLSTPNDIIIWLNQLFSGKILSDGSLASMTSIISEEDAKPIDLMKISLQKQQDLNKHRLSPIGAGMGMGLVYFKNYGYAWVHAGGTLGYESFYTYNPCKGIAVVLMYNVKPKQQLIFTKIVGDIFNVLDQSPIASAVVSKFSKGSSFPSYCKHLKLSQSVF